MMRYNDEIEASIKEAIEYIFGAGGRHNFTGQRNYAALREKYQQAMDKLDLEKISEGLNEVAAYVDDAQGEWNAVEIPYCPNWVVPYKELEAMIGRIQDLLESINAKE
jgi:hypothetical protein